MVKKNKWLIVILTMLVGVAGVSGAGYFGLKQYQKYQTGIIKKEKASQEIQQQKDLVVEKLKQEVEVLKNKKPEIIIKEISARQIGVDDISIIKEWRPRVAYIDCKVVFNGTNMGEQSGSGYVLGSDEQSGEVFLLTNKHITDIATHYPDGKSTGFSLNPTSCDIKLPGDSKSMTAYGPFGASDKEDWALIAIKTPTPYMKTIIKNIWDGGCNGKAELGEKILILGYPGIGDQNDVTVTDGIVSGYDGKYYITSAKIEHGNSGGVAISLKNNCYLGIPTFVVSGELESLARILNINTIFPN